MATHASKAQLYQKDTVTVKLDAGVFTALEQFKEHIKTHCLRSAAYAGAKILYGEMKMRASSTGGTGQLASAIYHWHDDKLSTDARQVYAIGVNKKKAPHWHFVEFGHWQVYKAYIGKDGQWHTVRKNGKPVLAANPQYIPAKPYIRTTYDAKMQSAIEAVKTRMAEKIKEFKAW